MRIIVRVKPSSPVASVTIRADGSFEVRVREHAERGKANAAVIDALARHFSVSRSRISIVAGHAARTKIVILR